MNKIKNITLCLKNFSICITLLFFFAPYVYKTKQIMHEVKNIITNSQKTCSTVSAIDWSVDPGLVRVSIKHL